MRRGSAKGHSKDKGSLTEYRHSGQQKSKSWPATMIPRIIDFNYETILWTVSENKYQTIKITPFSSMQHHFNINVLSWTALYILAQIKLTQVILVTL